MNLFRASRKRLLPWLCVMASVLWGYNMYQIMSAVRASNPDETGIPISTTIFEPDGREIEVRYSGDFRDPFIAADRAEAPPEEPTDDIISPAEHSVEYPAIALIGIVGETALVRLSTAETIVARKGDSLGDWRVIGVGKHELIIAKENQQLEIDLEN